MRPSTIFVAALAVVPGALAVDKMKNVIVWLEDDSLPMSIIEKAKNAIIDAGGKVTHDYSFIRYASRKPIKLWSSAMDQRL
jgi:hypothetical protein